MIFNKGKEYSDGMNDEKRLLFKVDLEPIQGSRFQPTGFPDLGAAEIPSNTGNLSLLVESEQSMANRLEDVCLNPNKDDFVDTLSGLPMVKVVDGNDKQVTNSVLEAHRTCSYYIIDDKGSEIKKKLEELEESFTNGVNIKETAKLLFKLDPNALLHGIWASQIGKGRIKIPRALSSFIEASNVKTAISGGVMLDNVNPSKESEDGGGAAKGQGHIPFSRIEYTADSITAYFNLDLEQIRGYGLKDCQTNLLIKMALWKIRTFLESGLRLRTACDLKIKKGVENSNLDKLPSKDEIDTEIKQLIKECKDELPEPIKVVFNKKR